MTLKQHLSDVVMCYVMFFSALGKPFVILLGSGCLAIQRLGYMMKTSFNIHEPTHHHEGLSR